VDTATVSLVEVPTGYTLADAIAGLPFSVNLPTAPTITSEATVTSNAELSAALAVNGQRINISPGTYNGFTVYGADQEIIIGAGCVFGDVVFSSTARREIFRAADPRNCSMTLCRGPEAGAGPQDILIDGVYVFSTESVVATRNRNFWKGDRIAILNSFFRMVDFPLSSFNQPPDTHFIIANCDMQNFGATVPGHTEQAGVRFHNLDPFVFVDNRVRKEGGEKQVFRVHLGDGADCQYTYVARNQFENINHCWIEPQGAGATADIFEDVWFEDNDLYVSQSYGGNFIGVSSESGTILRYRVRNNRFYGSSNPSEGFGIFKSYDFSVPPWIGPSWTIENNVIQPYTTPPSWGFQ
jgi:hypothetical protein